MDFRDPKHRDHEKKRKGMPPVSYRNTKSLAYDAMKPIKIDTTFHHHKSPATLRDHNAKHLSRKRPILFLFHKYNPISIALRRIYGGQPKGRPWRQSAH